MAPDLDINGSQSLARLFIGRHRVNMLNWSPHGVRLPSQSLPKHRSVSIGRPHFLALVHGEALAAETPQAAFLPLDGVGHELPREVWDKPLTAISHLFNQT